MSFDIALVGGLSPNVVVVLPTCVFSVSPCDCGGSRLMIDARWLVFLIGVEFHLPKFGKQPKSNPEVKHGH